MKTILVVDDDDGAMLPLLQHYLQSRFPGWVLVTARDGADALIAYKNTRPNFVVTDFYMPKMNGEQLAVAIKEKDPELPIFMVTGARASVTKQELFAGIYSKDDIDGVAEAIFEYMKTFKRKERSGAVRAKTTGNF